MKIEWVNVCEALRAWHMMNPSEMLDLFLIILSADFYLFGSRLGKIANAHNLLTSLYQVPWTPAYVKHMVWDSGALGLAAALQGMLTS